MAGRKERKKKISFYFFLKKRFCRKPFNISLIISKCRMRERKVKFDLKKENFEVNKKWSTAFPFKSLGRSAPIGRVSMTKATNQIKNLRKQNGKKVNKP